MKVFLHKALNRVDVLDDRFYQYKDDWFPSVTTVLGSYPKGFAYQDWLKSNGFNSDHILKRAAEQGSNVHNAVEAYLNGAELQWIAGGVENYTLKEWQMICRFLEFHQKYVLPSNGQVASETQLFSPKLKLGGTSDLVCSINGETWLIDFKTGNGIYRTHEIQLALYKEMWEEFNEPRIDRYGVLWLNAATRTEKQFQGKGWQLKEFTKSHEHNMKLYDHTRALWDQENPNYRPKNLSYPNSFSLDNKLKERGT